MSADRSMPEQGTVWQHYKGGLYRVIGYGLIAATCEPAVIYQDANNEMGMLWVRPVADWFHMVDGRSRFEQVQS